MKFCTRRSSIYLSKKVSPKQSLIHNDGLAFVRGILALLHETSTTCSEKALEIKMFPYFGTSLVA